MQDACCYLLRCQERVHSFAIEFVLSSVESDEGAWVRLRHKLSSLETKSLSSVHLQPQLKPSKQQTCILIFMNCEKLNILTSSLYESWTWNCKLSARISRPPIRAKTIILASGTMSRDKAREKVLCCDVMSMLFWRMMFALLMICKVKVTSSRNVFPNASCDVVLTKYVTRGTKVLTRTVNTMYVSTVGFVVDDVTCRKWPRRVRCLLATKCASCVEPSMNAWNKNRLVPKITFSSCQSFTWTVMTSSSWWVSIWTRTTPSSGTTRSNRCDTVLCPDDVTTLSVNVFQFPRRKCVPSALRMPTWNVIKTIQWTLASF